MTSLYLERDAYKKFPEFISQALQKLEGMSKVASTPQFYKLQQQIVDENIFYLTDASGEDKTLNAVEELVVVRCIAQYLSNVFDPGKRNFVFIALFSTFNDESQKNFKSRILSSLVSLAVATHNVAVLDAAAVWMQQVGCFSLRCSRVGMCLQDFFQSNIEAPEYYMKALNSLPSATPFFTANLITSWSQIYAKVGINEVAEEPPKYLLRMIIDWLRSEPQLILSPLTTPMPGVSLPMTALLAISPLSKLCIEAPFFNCSNQNTLSPYDAYAELHLLLLQSIQYIVSIQSKIIQREILCAEHIKSMSDSLLVHLNRDGVNQSDIEISLNRLAQLTLVTFHTNCLSGKIAEMWNSLKKLPKETRLMETLLKLSSC